MRTLFVASIGLLMTAGLALADKVEVKEVHLCCGQCVKGVAAVLGKVDGVTGAKCDQKGKTVTFTAKDAKVAEAAVKALYDAGFFGQATDDGKELKIEVTAPKSEKADDVTVKNVHVCCKSCENAINGLFKDAKVTYSGTGPMKEVKISGKGLDKAAIFETLHKGGFSGKFD